MERDTALAERAAALTERDTAQAARDAAIIERNTALWGETPRHSRHQTPRL